MNRPALAALLLATVTMLPTPSAALETCKPNYQLVHSSCKQTGKIVRFENTKITDLLAHKGACEISDIMALCRDGFKQIMDLYPGTKPEDIRITDAHPVARHDYCKVLQSKQDIHCSYDVKYPIMETIADDSCPVIDVVEASKCFATDEVNVSADDLKSCLDAEPKTKAQWWLKAACLSDLNKAAHSFRAKGLTAEDNSEIERQIKMALRMTSRSTLEPIHNYLVTRKNSLKAAVLK